MSRFASISRAPERVDDFVNFLGRIMRHEDPEMERRIRTYSSIRYGRHDLNVIRFTVDADAGRSLSRLVERSGKHS
jgi:hypothetical protein